MLPVRGRLSSGPGRLRGGRGAPAVGPAAGAAARRRPAPGAEPAAEPAVEPAAPRRNSASTLVFRTLGSHNFNSHNFKWRVSNPRTIHYFS